MTSMEWFSVQRCHFSRKKLDGTGSDIEDARMRVDTSVGCIFYKVEHQPGDSTNASVDKKLNSRCLCVLLSFSTSDIFFPSCFLFRQHEENQVIECKQKQSGEREREE